MTDTHSDHEGEFATLVLSLVTNAAILLGDLADPATGTAGAPNIDAASHMIDLLAMLEAKTRGNLSGDEEHLLRQVLYDLRMRFVAVKGQLGQQGQQDQPGQQAPADPPRIIVP